jgi:hypothetical protein
MCQASQELSPLTPGMDKGGLHRCCIITSSSISSRYHFAEGTTSVSVKLLPPNSDKIVTCWVPRGGIESVQSCAPELFKIVSKELITQFR